jgi:thymidylate synthase ThyX
VAEHAVFNFDVIDISRLAIEALERFRLCSYTEKSQRYIRLDDDYVLPAEVRQAGLEQAFTELVQLQNQSYHQCYEGVLQQLKRDNPRQAARRRGRQALEGQAKEDARYVTSLATCGQLGLTANARNLELACRRLAAHPLDEVRRLAAALHEPAHQVAPSLILFAEPGSAELQGPAARAELAARFLPGEPPPPPAPDSPAARLLDHTPEPDLQVAAALLHRAGQAGHAACLERARALAPDQLRQLFVTALAPLTLHDPPPRAFELASFRFEVIVSAACFGQLKRHRMATVEPQPYDPALGATLPASLERAGLAEPFAEVMRRSEALHQRLAASHPDAAPYALTQAHRRRVLVQMNTRELIHFSRLRQDQHAQWDIRALADQMLAQARVVAPLSLMLACGKDRFDELRQQTIG